MQLHNEFSPLLLLFDKQHPCGVRLVPFLAPLKENSLFKRRHERDTNAVADDSTSERARIAFKALDNFAPPMLACWYTVAPEPAPPLCRSAVEWWDYDADLMPLDLDEDGQDDLMASYYSEIMSEEDMAEELSFRSHCSSSSTVDCTPAKTCFSNEAEACAGVLSEVCAC
eukprot:GEMP01078534.1.p1 GENE.GEMP01078534.1~~GEMP01078534.1.p1  ORF type:complete len:170 (+),score=48.62 GEMP01078534.1:159-668(+)